MRQDMHQLTRVRNLDVSGQRKLFSRGNVRDLDSLPAHQSMRSSVPHYSYPRIDNIRPAARWLEQQVGRPWDAVFGEMRERFDARNRQQAQTLNYLRDQVSVNVYLDVEGVARLTGAFWHGDAVSGLYVHPKTRLLCEVPVPSRARIRAEHKAKREAAKAAECVVISELLQLRLVQGLWFWVELAEVTEPETIKVPAYVDPRTGEVLVREYNVCVDSTVCRDVLTGQQFRTVRQALLISARDIGFYGRAGLYAKRKWQACSRDIERYVRPH